MEDEDEGVSLEIENANLRELLELAGLAAAEHKVSSVCSALCFRNCTTG